MNWLFQLDTINPVAHAVAALALVCCAGMALGSFKVRGVGLGTAGVFSSNGLLWVGVGLGVTMVPLVLAGLFARGVLKTNYAVLAGLLAGSVTDPPALAFATNMTKSDAPTVAYATVYPLTVLLRILCAQVLALVLFQ